MAKKSIGESNTALHRRGGDLIIRLADSFPAARLHLTKRIPEYHDLLTCSTARQSSEEPAFGLVHNDPGNP